MAKTDSALGVLIAAIVAKHLATPALTTAMKGPWQHSKPASSATSPSYAIIIPGVSVDRGWTCRSYYWLHQPEFRFYDKTPEATNALADLWRSVFAAENLTMTFSTGGFFMHRVIEDGRVEDDPKSVQYASVSMKFQTYIPR